MRIMLVFFFVHAYEGNLRIHSHLYDRACDKTDYLIPFLVNLALEIYLLPTFHTHSR